MNLDGMIEVLQQDIKYAEHYHHDTVTVYVAHLRAVVDALNWHLMRADS